MAANWKWDITVNRYRDLTTGHFLSRDQAMVFVNESAVLSGNYTDGLADLITSGKLNAGDWYEMMKQEIKTEYINQYLLGIGGRQNMTQSDWGTIGGGIADQYRYLKGFFEEVAGGNLTYEQIAMRARMYTNSAREMFERAQAKMAKKTGFDEEFWEVDSGVENCVDCLEYNSMGWVKIADNPYDGAYPGSGKTKCITSCHCGIRYRNSSTDEGMWESEE